jgi:IMP dehydrogenase
MTNEFKLDNRYTNALNYDDVFIIPKYSTIASRKEVDISTKINNQIVKVPIVNANMETIADEYLCSEVRNAGGVAALHRFQDIESACIEYLQVVIQGINKNVDSPIFVSIGVNRDYKERAQELYKAGARDFIVDIAHGDSYQMKSTIQWMKSNLPECFIMAGNVATEEAVRHLGLWGADAVKVGIGNGAVCTTKNITGITVPMFSSLQDCVMAKHDFEQKYGKKLTIFLGFLYLLTNI